MQKKLKNGAPIDEDPEEIEPSPFENPPPFDPTIEQKWGTDLTKGEKEALKANQQRQKETHKKEEEKKKKSG